MKLIIDIPERYYEFCRECVINRTDTVDQQFIANGTPYEERPKGEWISVDEFMFDWQCSKCQCGIKGSKTAFCPHCGADMRGRCGMTNKEAIEVLKPLFEQCKGTDTCLGYIEHFFSKDEETALDLAIKALEEKVQNE